MGLESQTQEIQQSGAMGRDDLNYVGHRSCVQKASARAREAIEREDSDSLAEHKLEVGGQERGRLERVT